MDAPESAEVIDVDDDEALEKISQTNVEGSRRKKRNDARLALRSLLPSKRKSNHIDLIDPPPPPPPAAAATAAAAATVTNDNDTAADDAIPSPVKSVAKSIQLLSSDDQTEYDKLQKIYLEKQVRKGAATELAMGMRLRRTVRQAKIDNYPHVKKQWKKLTKEKNHTECYRLLRLLSCFETNPGQFNGIIPSDLVAGLKDGGVDEVINVCDKNDDNDADVVNIDDQASPAKQPFHTHVKGRRKGLGNTPSRPDDVPSSSSATDLIYNSSEVFLESGTISQRSSKGTVMMDDPISDEHPMDDRNSSSSSSSSSITKLESILRKRGDFPAPQRKRIITLAITFVGYLLEDGMADVDFDWEDPLNGHEIVQTLESIFQEMETFPEPQQASILSHATNFLVDLGNDSF